MSEECERVRMLQARKTRTMIIRRKLERLAALLLISVMLAAIVACTSVSSDGWRLASFEQHDRIMQLHFIAPRSGLQAPQVPSLPLESEFRSLLLKQLPGPSDVDAGTTVQQVIQEYAEMSLVWVQPERVWHGDRMRIADIPYASVFNHIAASPGWRPNLYECILCLLDYLHAGGNIRPPCWDDAEDWIAEYPMYDPFATIVGSYIYLFSMPIEPCGTWGDAGTPSGEAN